MQFIYCFSCLCIQFNLALGKMLQPQNLPEPYTLKTSSSNINNLTKPLETESKNTSKSTPNFPTASILPSFKPRHKSFLHPTLTYPRPQNHTHKHLAANSFPATIIESFLLKITHTNHQTIRLNNTLVQFPHSPNLQNTLLATSQNHVNQKKKLHTKLLIVEPSTALMLYTKGTNKQNVQSHPKPNPFSCECTDKGYPLTTLGATTLAQNHSNKTIAKQPNPPYVIQTKLSPQCIDTQKNRHQPYNTQIPFQPSIASFRMIYILEPLNSQISHTNNFKNTPNEKLVQKPLQL
jgi:hypothetical protein